MKDTHRIKSIIKNLHEKYPKAKTSLSHRNAIEMLIATILSAQCTDDRVNLVTGQLFKKYLTARDFANADIDKLQQEIRSTGFYKNKAKNIINCCKILLEKYHGKVPDAIGELISLPGVGRKTANVVL